MNKKEVEFIAWELLKIIECVETAEGRDAAMEIANTAIDSVENIVDKFPKIQKEIENLGVVTRGK